MYPLCANVRHLINSNRDVDPSLKHFVKMDLFSEKTSVTAVQQHKFIKFYSISIPANLSLACHCNTPIFP